MAIKKLGSIPNDIATATPALHPISTFLQCLGAPKLYTCAEKKEGFEEMLHYEKAYDHNEKEGKLDAVKRAFYAEIL